MRFVAAAEVLLKRGACIVLYAKPNADKAWPSRLHREAGPWNEHEHKGIHISRLRISALWFEKLTIGHGNIVGGVP